MKMQNKITGNIVDVSAEHANGVLIPQGKYVVYVEPVKEEKVSKPAPKKKVKPSKEELS